MAASRINIIARAFSSTAAQQQMVKPPVQVFGLDGRYATALFSAASKQKSLDAVEKDLLKFQGLLKTDVRLAEFVKDPTIKRSVKVNALKAVGTKASLNEATTNLLSLLAENGRLKNINGVVNAFKIIMAANRGEVVCEVITAKPLDAETKSKLESTLKGFLKPGQTILLTTKLDPSILGGMVVSIGDKYVDMSVASKVKKYSDIIKAAV
ncbi:ATP synthase subunit O, mitochondrial [Diprion similis]|uniref:ATP synthase subunit O, mitochondrial n=1 Tax=Diprion similis TaxID=362088 RepID=UPI001EF99793|nr:ATP synthase subunit O, mitochondrial [Diprion similis]